MTSFNSYPKIWHFGHPNTQALVGVPVRVEEKVDGSQFSFGVIDGVLRCKSRRVEMNPESPTDLFALAATTANSLWRDGKLVPGWTYRGEAFKSPKHNTLEYGRIPTGGVMLFDVACGREWYLSRPQLEQASADLGLECVPQLGTETFDTYEQVTTFLDRESILGKNKIEGVVLKPVHRLFGEDAKPLYAKVVSEDFKELHRGNEEYRVTKKWDSLDTIAASVSTVPRWRKTRERLRDEGRLEGSPRDLAFLVKELQNDIEDECHEYIKEELYRAFRKKLLGTCVRGFPEWYKQQLAIEVFDA